MAARRAASLPDAACARSVDTAARNAMRATLHKAHGARPFHKIINEFFENFESLCGSALFQRSATVNRPDIRSQNDRPYLANIQIFEAIHFRLHA
jgi:hypothetical protein